VGGKGRVGEIDSLITTPYPNPSGSHLLIDHPPSSQVAGSNSLLGFLALLGRASLLPVVVVVEAVTHRHLIYIILLLVELLEVST